MITKIDKSCWKRYKEKETFYHMWSCKNPLKSAESKIQKKIKNKI